MRYLLFRTAVIGTLLLGISLHAYAQTQANAVRMQVYGIHQGNDIVYNYKLINNSTETLQNFVIGSTYSIEDKMEYPQLERLPSGWSYGKTSETGTEIILASGSTRQPPNWTAHVYGQEESGNYYLKWETSPDGQASGISPGQSLDSFSVNVPLFDSQETPSEYYNAGVSVSGWKENDVYLTGNFKVSYWDTNKNELQDFWGPLEIADTTPPTLTVKLSPVRLWPPNEKMVPITATITVNDDYDPNPVVKLLSITANEHLDKDDIQGAKLYTDVRQFKLKAEREDKTKAGRIYTVTYFANDASGNQSIASAAITVPHDWDNKEKIRRRDSKNARTDMGDSMPPLSK